jgi:hypothetical protein
LPPAEKTVVRLNVGTPLDRLEGRKEEVQGWCEALLVFGPLGEGSSVSERRTMRERQRGGQVEMVDDG